MLLPEEPAPELGVKSKRLHFLTAGDQGVCVQARVGRGGWGRSVDRSGSGPCPLTGVLRVWEAASGQCVHTQRQRPGPGQELTRCALARSAGLLLSVTADHNLLLYETCSLQLQKQVSAAPAWPKARGASPPLMQTPACVPPAPPPQFAGYSEEVLDVRFLGPEDSHIVVASNSPSLKVFELQTMACQILHGHTGQGAELTPPALHPGLECCLLL